MHGLPETSDIWGSLSETLGRESVALRLTGFSALRPSAFTPTKDAYAARLDEMLTGFGRPVDVVAHDIEALMTMFIHWMHNH